MHGMPTQLLELAAEREAIWTTLTEGIEEDDDVARSALEELYEASTAKTEAELTGFLQDMATIEDAMDADIGAMNAFVARWTDRIAAKARARETIRRHVQEAMGLFGKTKVHTNAGTWSIRRTQVADIYSEADIPDTPDLWRIKRELNRAEIKRRLDAGETVPGAQLIAKPVLQRRG